MKKKTTLKTLSLIGLATILWLAGVAIRGKQIAVTPVEPSNRLLPVHWEHGWKNDRVIATRYVSSVKGYHIGFRFPRNPYHANNAAIFEFYQQHGGLCFQSGIGPGAEQFVTFQDVYNAETADKKLQKLLPQLGELLESLDWL